MNIGEKLQTKIGPLPAYMWGIAIGGGLLVFFLIRGKSSATTPTNDTNATDGTTTVDPVAGPPGPAGPAGDSGPAGATGPAGAAGKTCPDGYHAEWIRIKPTGPHPGKKWGNLDKTLVCVPNRQKPETTAKIAGVTSDHDDDLSWAPNMSLPAFTDQQNIPSITHAPFSSYSPQTKLHDRAIFKPSAYISGEPEFVTPVEGEFIEQPLVGKAPPKYPYRVYGRPSKVG